MQEHRPIHLGVRVSHAEDIAFALIAQSEGLQKSSWARRTLRLALRNSAQVLPAELLTALNIQQTEIVP